MKKTVNDIILSNIIKKKNKIIIIKFWAEWCPSCKILKNILEEIKKFYKKKIIIIKININYNSYSSEKFSIKNIPTLVIIKNKNLIKKLQGFINKDFLKNLIEKNI